MEISKLNVQSEYQLVADLCHLIDEAKSRVASVANVGITMLYWHIGERINREVLGYQRAAYRQRIVSTVSTQLSWSYFVEVLSLENNLQREFYLTMAAEEKWSVRTLREKIDGMLFERTVISDKPEEIIRAELESIRKDRKMSPDMVFQSPYFLEFTGLKDGYTEETLENTLIHHIE